MVFKILQALASNHPSNFIFYLSSLCSFYPNRSALPSIYLMPGFVKILFIIVTWGDRLKEGIVREFGIEKYTRLYLKWITNKLLLYSTENSAQCYVAVWMRED